MTQRKVKTTPFQREILWSLAENGRESVLNILCLLQQKFVKYTDTELLKEFRRSSRILSRMGCLCLTAQVGSEKRSVHWEKADDLSFETLYEWNAEKRLWQVNSSKVFEGELVLQLTFGGVETLKIISEQSSEPTPIWKPKE